MTAKVRVKASPTQPTRSDTVTVASLLPFTVQLVLFHIDDRNRADRFPVACEFIVGKLPNSNEPALTHGVPRWVWEGWEEQHQNEPAVRDRLLYALPYPGQAPFEPDMLALAAAIQKAIKEKPSPLLLLNLRDAVGFLASHIAATETTPAPLPSDKRSSLENIRTALDILDHERRQMTRPAILADTRSTRAMVHHSAGILFSALDTVSATAPKALGDVEEYFAAAPPDVGGVKPVRNQYDRTAVQTCAAIAVEVFHLLKGELPGKRHPKVIDLCGAIWAAAGGKGVQDWFRALQRAVADQRADLDQVDQRSDRTAWVRDGLSKQR